jgi:2-polyprenyl-6-hydroxyphenyl methylase/3-demethylubiquinone-9 3-methyltransferase
MRHLPEILPVASFVRKLIDFNVACSRRFDVLLPQIYQIDGNRDFIDRFCPAFIKPGIRLVDVGGGKQPYLSALAKSSMGMHVTGIDISQEELDRAPVGAYDESLCVDITQYRGESDADMLVCQAVLEHVRDVEKAFAAFASILKPGGLALLWVPSRNAAFARLNMLLPETWKRKILFFVFPHTEHHHGFAVYYDRCTPRQFRQLAEKYGFKVESQRLYYSNKYFYFFLPLHVLWRAWVIVFRAINREQGAETFAMALRKVE